MTDRMAEIRAYNTRQGHILSGRALPSADELLRLMPFFEDSIREDVLEWAKSEIARLERLDSPERRALLPFQGLLNDLEDSGVVGAKLAQRIHMLMLALPEDDHDGRLRCSVYRAALGQRASMITLACNAATALAASADTLEGGAVPLRDRCQIRPFPGAHLRTSCNTQPPNHHLHRRRAMARSSLGKLPGSG